MAKGFQKAEEWDLDYWQEVGAKGRLEAYIRMILNRSCK
jgi:hypothetical protein